MVFVLENRPHQTGEPAPGADLEKEAGAVSVQVADFVDELHRPDELIGEQRGNAGSLIGIRFAGGVGVNLAPGRGDVGPAELGSKGLRGIDHESAVKRRGDRKTLASNTAPLEGLHRFLDLVGRTGQNELGRSILVGYHQGEIILGDDGFDGALIGLHRQHGAAVAVALAHEPPAEHGKNTQRLGVEHLRRMQGHQLAVAVTRHRGGHETEPLEHAQGAHRNGADGRLGHLGGAQRSFLILFRFIVESGMGIDDIAELSAGPVQPVQTVQ